jgi:hypothetical protein
LIREFTDQLATLIEAMQRDHLLVERALQASGGRGKAAQPATGTRRYGWPSPGRQLQGRYIGRLAGLQSKDRARVRAIAKQQGIAAAGRAADKIVGRGRQRAR